MTPPLPPFYLLIDAKRKIKIPVTDIFLLHGEENYTNFFCKNRKQHLMPRTLKFFEKDLLSQGFCRVHRSSLINLAHIKEIDLANDTVTLSNNTSVKISRRKRKAFLERLGDESSSN
ncbi:MAG: LytR/AlgR family response regulator transcription factor [Spirosomataceae bacterium]|jgi:two-component system LytT family response regulator